MPSLDKYDDDEVLEFQMGVLQLMKKIKNSRQIRESSSFNLSSLHREYFTQEYQNSNIQEATNSISTNMTTTTSLLSPASAELTTANSLQSPTSVESCYSNYTDIDFNDF